MLNAAIVGLGWWGKILTQTLAKSDKITVVKLADVDADGGGAFAAEHGIDFTTDYSAVLADDAVDAVVLATPHSVHEEQIVTAAEAGKHIFCEKPFCLNRASALRAMEAIEKAGVQVAIGHERRFEPPIMDALALARDGKLGALMHVEANFSHDIFAALDDTNWRLKTDESPAGGLTATLIHLMDLSINLFGQPDRVLASVECHGGVVKNGDTLTAQVKFETAARHRSTRLPTHPSFPASPSSVPTAGPRCVTRRTFRHRKAGSSPPALRTERLKQSNTRLRHQCYRTLNVSPTLLPVKRPIQIRRSRSSATCRCWKP